VFRERKGQLTQFVPSSFSQFFILFFLRLPFISCLDWMRTGRACWSLGNAHAAMGNHEKALHYAQRHLEISREVNRVVNGCAILLHLRFPSLFRQKKIKIKKTTAQMPIFIFR
jgi:urease accessory protein UreE